MPTFTVQGIPAPQGSKRAIPHKRGGVYTGKVSLLESAGDKVKKWRAAVHTEAAKFEQISGPIAVVIDFWMPRPLSHYRTGRNAGTPKTTAPRFHTSRPDTDKLVRSTLDALTTSQLIEDDSRVVHLTATKRYANIPGATITITPWTGEQP